MRFILIGLLFTILFFSTSLKAQQGIDIEKRTYIKTLMCAKHEELTGNLKLQHGESRKWWSINSSNEIVELFVNNKNGAWTIIITNKKQMACALIGGDHSGANYDIDSTVELKQ
jgi:hypothetical protein